MLKSQVFQYYTEKLWEKIKTTFMSKNDALNGVVLDYKWKLIKSSINDVSIFLPDLTDIDEIYIEMSSPDSIILHQATIKKDGLIPVGTNATSKEILLDGVFDYQTYVTYDVATNKITPSVFEGVTIDSTTSITTSVYVKEHVNSNITVPAGSIAYDNTISELVSEDVQGAIDELKSDVSNITLDAEHTTYNNSASGLSATNVQGAIDENASIGNQALAIVKGRNQALAYNSYSEMITALNGMTKDELKRGQNIYIGTVGVPDLWVYSVETTKSTYTYTNDETFVNGLNNNVTVQVGYYKLAQLETQKVDIGGINNAIDNLQSDITTLENKPTYAFCLDKGFVDGSELMTELPYAFYQGSAVVYNNEIHILGGAGSYNHHTKYNFDTKTWAVVSTEIPYTFYQGSAVVYNNEIHILGGGGNTKAHYKWNGSSWSSASTLPYAFYQSSAVVYNNELHILGGMGNKTAHYKWNGSSWTSISTLPYNFTDGCAVVYNNELHILGGNSSNEYTKHYKFNSSSSSWTSVATLPYATTNGSAVVYNNELHILGSGNGKYNQHCVYDGNKWIEKNDLLYNFYYGSAVSYKSNIYLLGGSNSQNKFCKLKYGTYVHGYVKANTNIYLPYETIPDTDNLEVIEDGYKVTEDGYVVIYVE